MIYKHRKRKKKKMKKLLFISLLLACACSYASSKFGFNPTDNSIVLPDLARTIARWCIVPLVILVVGWAVFYSPLSSSRTVEHKFCYLLIFGVFNLDIEVAYAVDVITFLIIGLPSALLSFYIPKILWRRA